MGLQMAASLVAATFLVALLIWTPATVDAVREYKKKHQKILAYI